MTGSPQASGTGAGLLPLSAAQAGVWFAQVLAPDDPAWTVGDYVVLDGRLDVPRLAAAVAAAVAEIDALRLELVADSAGGTGTAGQPPAQRVRDADADPLAVHDLRAEPDPERAALERMRADLHAVTDPTAPGALFGTALYRVGPRRHLWYLRFHHIVIDGYSVASAVRLVATRYRELCAGTPFGPSPVRPLAGLVEADRAYRGSQRYAADREFWLRRCADLPPEPVTLSTRPPAAARRLADFHRVRRALPPATRASLTAAATAIGGSWADVLLGGIAGYLHRMTGATDVVLGMPFAGRLAGGTLRIPGMAVTVLPLRLTVDPATSVADLGRLAAAELAQARRHQRYRGEELARDLDRLDERRPLHGPVVNIKAFDHDLDFAGAEARVHNLAAGPVADLTLSVLWGSGEGADDLVIELDGNTGRYGEAELGAHADRLIGFLTHFAASPDLPVAAVELTGAAERASLLGELSGAGERVPDPYTPVHLQIAARAWRTPDAPALVAGTTTLTHGELDERVARLAALLAARGAGPGRTVAVAVSRSADLLTSLLAVLWTGAAYQPLDPAHPTERLGYALADGGAVAVLADAVTRPAVVAALAAARRGALGAPSADAVPELISPAEAEGLDGARPAPGIAVPLSAPAYVIHTSGSTGRPKGVIVSHGALAAFCSAMGTRFPLGPDDRLLAVTTASFDIAGLELFLPLLHGGRVVMADGDDVRDPDRLAALAGREAVTVLQGTPSLLRMLLAVHPDLLRRVRVLVGGEAVPAALARQLASLSIEALDVYGPTEATIWATTGRLDPSCETDPPIGRPLPGTRAYVLDEALRPVPAGAVGELYLAGPQLAHGYTGRPSLTATRFVADPFGDPGDRLYRTGDLARWNPPGAADGGTLQYLGRTDHQVKVRGFRIELGEVEAALGELDGVAEAAAAVQREGEAARLVGYLVPAVSGPGIPALAELHAALAERLPDYMVPSAFVVLDTLPTTLNGKLDRAALPAPGADDLVAPQERTRDPEGPVETALCAAFAQVLGVGMVGALDSFFHLGGDSVTALQVCAQLRAEGLAITPKDVFTARTPAALAGLARPVEDPAADDSARGDSAGSPPERGVDGSRAGRRGGAGAPGSAALEIPEQIRAALVARYGPLDLVAPLSPVQEGMLFHSTDDLPGTHANGQGGVYTSLARLDLDGALDASRLRAAFTGLLARHEALRAAFLRPADLPGRQGSADPGTATGADLGIDLTADAGADLREPMAGLPDVPVQVVPATVELPWREIDLSAGDSAGADSGHPAGLEELTTEELHRPFDLARPPLLRVTLVRRGPRRHRLLLARHHLVMDGWSTPILLRELLIRYADPAAELPPVLPYSHYLDHLAARSPARVAADRAAWSAELGGLDGPTLLVPGSSGRPDGAAPREQRRRLDRPTAEGLAALSRRAGLTTGTLVQGVWALLLAGLTGRDDVVFGTTSAGRPAQLAGAETMIGLFATTTPVRVRLRPDEPVLAMLARLQDRQVSLREHGEIGLAEIQARAGVRRSRDGLLFDTLVVIENYPVGPALLAEPVAGADPAPPRVVDADNHGFTHYPVTLVLIPAPAGGVPTLVVEHHPDLVADEAAAALLDRTVALLERLVADPGARTGSVDLRLPAEPVTSRSGPPVGPDATTTVPELLARQVAASPEARAVGTADGWITFGELGDRIDRLARLLAERGAGPGTRVAIALPRDVDLVVAVFAVLQTGAAFLPLDLGHGPARLAETLIDARPVVLVTTSPTRFDATQIDATGFGSSRFDATGLDIGRFDGARSAVGSSDLGRFDTTGFDVARADTGRLGRRPVITAGPDGDPPGTARVDLDSPAVRAELAALPARTLHGRACAADSVAYVIYTSGSTGRPKGVEVTHGGLAVLAADHRDSVFGRAVAAAGGRRLRAAHTASFSFDSSWEQLLWLVLGHELFVVDEDTRRDPQALVELLRAQRIDTLDVTPSLGSQLVEWGLFDHPEWRPVLFLLGGEAVDRRLWERCREVPGVLVHNYYGPTEFTVDALGADVAASEEPVIGVPISGARAQVLDGWLRSCVPGVAGELYLSGSGVAQGYLGRPGLTAARFVAATGGSRRYRTGDVVVARADGVVEFRGRADDQVKIRGIRVEPGEVEAALVADSAVAAAAVVVDGEGSAARLVGYVVPARGGSPGVASHGPADVTADGSADVTADGSADVTADGSADVTGDGAAPASGADFEPGALRERLARRLPPHLVPAVVVALDALPMTVAGKLDRTALPPAGPPAGPAAGPGTGGREPAPGPERTVAAVFAELLGVQQVDADADFFALGGHSLLATRLVNRLRARTGRTVTIRELFDAPTVAGVAGRLTPVAEESRATAAPVAAAPTASDSAVPGAAASPSVFPTSSTSQVPPAAATATLPERPSFPSLSPAQLRLWFLERLDGPSPAYLIPFALRLTTSPGDPVDTTALCQAFADVVNRHEALRTRYPEGPDGLPFQLVEPSGAVAMGVRTIPPAELEAVRERLESQPFDLAAEVPVRATALVLGPDELVVSIVLHHIAGDEWSQEVLLRDLDLAYRARRSSGPGRAGAVAAVGSTPSGLIPAQASSALPVLTGQQPDWPDTPPSPVDLALLAADQLGDPADPQSAAARLTRYWRTTLDGLPGEIPLPLEHPRPARPSGAGAAVELRVPDALHVAVTRCARGRGITPFVVWQAAIALLLSRLGGGPDIPLGTPVSGRTGAIGAVPGVEDTVGYLVNTVVLRTDLSGDPSFAELLGRVRETVLDALAHAELPFEKVVDAVGPERVIGRPPLFQTMVVHRRAATGPAGLLGARSELLPEITRRARFDLGFVVSEWNEPDSAHEPGAPEPGAPEPGAPEPGAQTTGAHAIGGRTTVRLIYSTERAGAGTARALLERLFTVLGEALASPRLPIGALRVDSPADRAMIALANDTARPLPPLTLLDMLHAGAAVDPQAPAVLTDDAVLSHAELWERARGLAAALRAAGAGPERVVAVALPRSADLVVALVAVLETGAAYLPVDPELPADRIAMLLGDARPVTMITGDAPPAGPLADAQAHSGIPMVQVTACDSAGSGTPPRLDNAAYVIYTSGSTGRPKGVVVTHAAIANRIAWMQGAHPLTPADRVLQKTPAGFDVSVWEFFWALTVGAAVVVARPGGHRDPQYLAATVARRRVSVLHFVPSMLGAFLGDPAVTADPTWARSVRRVFCSGEALPRDTAARMRELLAASGGQGSVDQAEQAEVHNLYGPTEAAVDVTAWQVTGPADAATVPMGPADAGTVLVGPADAGTALMGPADAGTVPIGRPVWNTRTVVLDARLRPCPPGVPGELYLAGVQLARGYLGRPGLTAGRFVADPAGGPGERLYRTGDLARWSGDGRLEYLGRTDDQVKLRGFRIEPGEIAAVLSAQPDVAQAAVVLREDAPGRPRLVAYVVPAARLAPAAAAAATDRWRAAAAATLPEHMVPAAFVLLDALPTTINGKLDRAALPAPPAPRAAQPAAAPALPTRGEAAAQPGSDAVPVGPVSPGVPGRQASFTPSGDPVGRLCAVVAEVLGLEPAAVAATESFFVLGGDSIVAIQLVARARGAGLRFTVRDVFERATLAELAEVAVDAQARAPEPVAAPAELPDGPLPLLPAMGWLRRRGGSADRFSQTALVRIPGDITEETLRAGLHWLIATHDALRLRLARTEGVWSLHTVSSESPQSTPADVGLLRRVAGPVGEDLVRAQTDRAVGELDPGSSVLLRAVWFDPGPASDPGIDGDTDRDMRSASGHDTDRDMSSASGHDTDRDMSSASGHDTFDGPSAPHPDGLLLLVVHHLAVDGVSWRILLSQLDAAVAAAAGGRAPLADPAPSLRAVAHRLLGEAHDPGRLAELGHWLATTAPDPRERPLSATALRPERDTAATEQTLRRALSPASTEALLASVPAAFGADMQDVLLAALAAAVAPRTGGTLLVDVEGHGRHPFPGAGEVPDLSRTVGWLTSIHPVRLDLPGVDPADVVAGGPAAGELLKAVKERVRAVPDRGRGYQLLRTLHPQAADLLAGGAKAQVLVNYLGRVDVAADRHWTPVGGELGEAAEPRYGPGLPLTHPLELLGAVHTGPGGPALRLTLAWPAALFTGSEIEALADRLVDALAGLARHARDPHAGGRTPSDLTLVSLQQKQIDRLEGLLRRKTRTRRST